MGAQLPPATEIATASYLTKHTLSNKYRITIISSGDTYVYNGHPPGFQSNGGIALSNPPISAFQRKRCATSRDRAPTASIAFSGQGSTRCAQADDRCAGGTNAASASQHRRAHRPTRRKGFFVSTAVHGRQATSLSKADSQRRGISQATLAASSARTSIRRPNIRKGTADSHRGI